MNYHEEPIPGYSKYEVRVTTYYRTEGMKKFILWAESAKHAIDKTAGILKIFYPELDFSFECSDKACGTFANKMKALENTARKEIVYSSYKKICEFNGISSMQRSTIQAYLYLRKEETTVEIENIEYRNLINDKAMLQKYEDLEKEGRLITLPFKLGTPILSIMGGRSNYSLVTELFSLDHMKSYEEGFIFSDVAKAHERIEELRSGHATLYANDKPVLSFGVDRSFFTGENTNV